MQALKREISTREDRWREEVSEASRQHSLAEMRCAETTKKLENALAANLWVQSEFEGLKTQVVDLTLALHRAKVEAELSLQTAVLEERRKVESSGQAFGQSFGGGESEIMFVGSEEPAAERAWTMEAAGLVDKLEKLVHDGGEQRSVAMQVTLALSSRVKYLWSTFRILRMLGDGVRS